MQRADKLEKTDAWKDRRQKEKGVAEDEMVRQYHQLNGHEVEQTLGDNEGWGSLECYSSWSHKELNITQQLNNNKYSFSELYNCMFTTESLKNIEDQNVISVLLDAIFE